MLIVSDVHGEFSALGRLVARGEPVLILGDLINLVDYRTGEGIFSQVLGKEFALQAAQLRRYSDYKGLGQLWQQKLGIDGTELRHRLKAAVMTQYRDLTAALSEGSGFVIHGNADRPEALAAALPDGWTFADGRSYQIEGYQVGFVGGGTSTPLRVSGETTEEQIYQTLASMSDVEILCSHVPPQVNPLRTDVVTGQAERSSLSLARFLQQNQPKFHFFGDVHQPQASRWKVGKTLCVNTCYFRATHRACHLDPATGCLSWIKV